ncbi:hypothetical protein BC938DRAFT_475174, partial [Jimgerdemannia flammicorona]
MVLFMLLNIVLLQRPAGAAAIFTGLQVFEYYNAPLTIGRWSLRLYFLYVNRFPRTTRYYWFGILN